MDNQTLYPDAAQRLMTLVKQTFGTTFNAYFLGLPDDFIIADAAYPCCIIQKSSGTYKVGPTTADEVTENVYIHLLVNVKDGFGSPDDDDTVMRQLQTWVEGRDPNTGALLPTSLMFAIRNFLTLKSDSVPNLITINNDVNISYDAPKRQNINTREAVIDVTVTERQIVIGRSAN